MQIVDKNRVPLAEGAKVSVRVVSGPHGQPRTVEGVIETLYANPPGATLTLTAPTAAPSAMLRGVNFHRGAGESHYVGLPGQYEGDVFVCHKVFDDVEHASETWAEVI